MKLEDIRKLCGEATPGPWPQQDNMKIGSYCETIRECREYGCNALAVQIEPFSTEADAAFIAASRTLIPQMLAVIEAFIGDYNEGSGEEHKRAAAALRAMGIEPDSSEPDTSVALKALEGE